MVKMNAITCALTTAGELILLFLYADENFFYVLSIFLYISPSLFFSNLLLAIVRQTQIIIWMRESRELM